MVLKIAEIEKQLPTVVHEYDGERRGKLETRVGELRAEREELVVVRWVLLGEREEVGRMLVEMGADVDTVRKGKRKGKGKGKGKGTGKGKGEKAGVNDDEW